MKNLKVKIFGETIEVPAGTSLQQIADRYSDKFPSPIMIAKIGSIYKELRYTLKEDVEVELFDLSNMDGMRVYQRSVSFLLIAAASEVFGNEKKINICHAIKKNVYCEISDYIPTDDDLIALEAKMHELADLNLEIGKHAYHLEQAIDLLNTLGYSDKSGLFKYRNVSTVNLYNIKDVFDYFYGYMASSTGCLKLFKLVREADGFVLMFPSKENPTEIKEYSPLNCISETFREYSHIGKILNINNVGDLNDLITENKLGEIIRIAEALQEKKIAQIADRIMHQDGVKIILIAGPSSSGKTTFAYRLSVQLKINGIKPYTISLDDYFKNRSEVPLDEFGNPNFESIDFMNAELLNKNLTKLLNGEEIIPPRYNFITGNSELRDETFKLGENEIIIAEGIHGLNEIMTAAVPKDKKFKIFISALTALNIDDHNRISTSDTRLIRRLVRDYKTRGAAASRTIGMWPSVLKGEAQYIFPTQEEADAVFNSSLIYELSMLKQYADPLLFSIDQTSPLYSECKRLIKFLSCFLVSPTDEVPKNSILREFIGGSCFTI